MSHASGGRAGLIAQSVLADYVSWIEYTGQPLDLRSADLYTKTKFPTEIPHFRADIAEILYWKAANATGE